MQRNGNAMFTPSSLRGSILLQFEHFACHASRSDDLVNASRVNSKMMWKRNRRSKRSSIAKLSYHKFDAVTRHYVPLSS